MSLKSRMAEANAKSSKVNAVREALHRNERDYRLDKRVDAWSAIPEIGLGMKEMSESKARNLACNLDNQAAHMSRLSETQLATGFNNFKPENMLRLVRLAMPNCVRSEIFTEFAMETSKDSIKYVKPVYAKTANGKDLDDKVNDAASIYNNERNSYDEDGIGYRKAIYEVTEDRINQELATAPKVGESGDNFKTGKIGEGDDEQATITFTFAEKDGKWGDNGEKLLKGYTVVYYGNNENDVVAIETSRAVNGSTAFAIVDNETFESVEWGTVESGEGKNSHVLTVTLKKGQKLPEGKKLNCYARFDSENDFEGDYLGEVEIKMYDYQFEPRPTSIGVSWSQLSEIELDTSFNLSAEEYLVTYAAQAIKVALDYKAIRLAYQQAKLNKKYHVEFDAAYSTNRIGVKSADGEGNPTVVQVENAGTKDGYVANAQTIGLAIETVGDNMLNDINRGGVTRIVCGPSAGTYLRLAGGFTAKGANIGQEGVKQIGTFEGIPVFKAPASIIPTDEMLTVYKNVNNESDIGIAFGTLIPFFSTGIIQRKNFYKEAGLATYGDWAVLNSKYFSIIKIKGLKEITNQPA